MHCGVEIKVGTVDLIMRVFAQGIAPDGGNSSIVRRSREIPDDRLFIPAYVFIRILMFVGQAK